MFPVVVVTFSTKARKAEGPESENRTRGLLFARLSAQHLGANGPT